MEATSDPGSALVRLALIAHGGEHLRNALRLLFGWQLRNLGRKGLHQGSGQRHDGGGLGGHGDGWLGGVHADVLHFGDKLGGYDSGMETFVLVAFIWTGQANAWFTKVRTADLPELQCKLMKLQIDGARPGQSAW